MHKILCTEGTKIFKQKLVAVLSTFCILAKFFLIPGLVKKLQDSEVDFATVRVYVYPVQYNELYDGDLCEDPVVCLSG